MGEIAIVLIPCCGCIPSIPIPGCMSTTTDCTGCVPKDTVVVIVEDTIGPAVGGTAGPTIGGVATVEVWGCVTVVGIEGGGGSFSAIGMAAFNSSADGL